MTMPADEMKAAATKLRTLITDLGDCRGPWYVVNREQHPYPQRIDNIGVPYVVASTATDPSHPPTIADYIVAMHPGVGSALAELLNQAAENYETEADTPDCPSCGEGCGEGHGERDFCTQCGDEAPCRCIAHVLAVARKINNGEWRVR